VPKKKRPCASNRVTAHRIWLPSADCLKIKLKAERMRIYFCNSFRLLERGGTVNEGTWFGTKRRGKLLERGELREVSVVEKLTGCTIAHLDDAVVLAGMRFC
jgi:hypothetical protein